MFCPSMYGPLCIMCVISVKVRITKTWWTNFMDKTQDFNIFLNDQVECLKYSKKVYKTPTECLIFDTVSHVNGIPWERQRDGK